MLILKKISKPLKKQGIRMKEKNNGSKIVFGIVLALGYGGLHIPPNVSVSEVIYALGTGFFL